MIEDWVRLSEEGNHRFLDDSPSVLPNAEDFRCDFSENALLRESAQSSHPLLTRNAFNQV